MALAKTPTFEVSRASEIMRNFQRATCSTRKVTIRRQPKFVRACNRQRANQSRVASGVLSVSRGLRPTRSLGSDFLASTPAASAESAGS